MPKKAERRRRVICPNCGQKMVCMNKFESICQLLSGFYAWYVCPRRKGEKGCGHNILFEISPKTKRLKKMVKVAKPKKRK